MKNKTNVLSVRVSPLVKFYLRKLSEDSGNPISFVFSEAIYSLVHDHVSTTKRAAWLREYRAEGGDKP